MTLKYGARAVWHFTNTYGLPLIDSGDYAVRLLGPNTLSELISPSEAPADGLVKVRREVDGVVFWADIATLEEVV